MKKILLSILLVFSTSLFAEVFTEDETKLDELHQVLVTHTVDIDFKNSTREEIFFGDLDDFEDKVQEIMKSMAMKGGETALTTLSASSQAIARGLNDVAFDNAGIGLGIGLVIGFLDPFVMSMYEDDQLILIYDYTENGTGKKSRVATLFVAPSFDDEDVIKPYLNDYLTKKGY